MRLLPYGGVQKEIDIIDEKIVLTDEVLDGIRRGDTITCEDIERLKTFLDEHYG